MGLVGVSTASHPSRTANVSEVRLFSLLLSVTLKPSNTSYSYPIAGDNLFLIFTQAMYNVQHPQPLTAKMRPIRWVWQPNVGAFNNVWGVYFSAEFFCLVAPFG